MRANVALYGRSGSGKTEIANYLTSKYGYIRTSTGSACREICQLLFQDESKTLLNRVTDAMKSIDENVWLRAALRKIEPGHAVVFDSMRFHSDYEYLRGHGFSLWRIDAPLDLRLIWLQRRG